MPARRETDALRAALAAAPAIVPEVIATMRAIGGALPAGDGVACFTRLYLAVTEAVEEELAGGRTTFRRPDVLARLDVVFAELWFDALRGSLGRPPSVPRAWAPLVDGRRRTDVAPIQFALAGMNAHINRDLPVALVRTWEELGSGPGDRDVRADYLAVNALLVETEARVRSQFATGVVGLADRALGDVDSAVAMWNVARACDAAWTNGATLWRLRDDPELRDAYLLALDRTTGFAGRGLLRPARPRVARLAALVRRLTRRRRR